MTQPASVVSLLENDGFVADPERQLTRAFENERVERCRSRRIRPDAPEPPRELP